ncbi:MULTISPECIES: 3-phosphoshikimate 1-carboxyvinyltransferase [Stenotrophomonas maltophilia group]|uniref:3-phosphoshikimate 1-carboxyvinyltransferase n=1 Tax=Stenotrophomonas maltophilia group TaxID=995085 RepID=UPI000DA7BB6C|nr:MULTISPECIES: 3-phosphoshikimate 1-carboxyvinyltransferase [Stenotrophomonas maltophilia group]MBA0401166.1 3-phosphoshikimate 1-carboxyvinyltransferase [Stenotrophomonas maltophilia]MCU1134620.1 3-phosphoshikimate 1-carboxyvinyltransferase [Stenotrophomonas maltophilia]MCU1194899.1 3-phosphoshikimate 1-carboxyvinyltransferase [Stenotrophomonas maltophilia]PZT04233.1 3-phosphoshikimate 1-carboxyvinyltransferase [Stenotrophomonas maltophilia]HDS1551320.1 3-phosphoshikimate 1-carboxyvinyltran
MSNAQHWIARKGQPLQGSLTIPGDKSVSHRSVMFAALADGTSHIEGFLEGEDTRATARIFSQLGVRIETPSPSQRVVHGVGIDGLKAPDAPLDCGNAGTGMRLLAGLLAGQSFDCTLIGDESLSGRPMRRVTGPLSLMGARIDTQDDGTPPLHVHGGQALHGIDFASPVASAQVKSAVLLAGLYAQGETCVTEPHPTRDYTERMLSAFGVDIAFSPGKARLRGGQRLRATDIVVPADFSSAAFYLVAASIIPGSELRLKQVGLNPRRTGLLHALRLMGADITEENPAEQGGEPVADLVVRYAPLKGARIPETLVPDMIDEFPALFVAAAAAEGQTVVSGAAELRVKESDRLAAMATGLRALGMQVDETEDGATLHGGVRLGSGTIESHGDHRIAMAFAIAGQISDGEVRINDIANVATSFPDFDGLARSAGFNLA